MPQPIWITPAGSIGVIPEEIFFSQDLSATIAPFDHLATCTATAATTNRITCTDATDAVPGRAVIFTGTTFGGITQNITYWVLARISATEFTISANADSATPVTLTAASGSMTATFYQRIYYRLQAGNLPAGCQLSIGGGVTGVPQAVSTVQGVPTEVSADVTSKFTVRAFTLTAAGNIDAIADRTFTLTITGDDPALWITPEGSIGTFFDGSEVNIQLQYTDADPGDTIAVRLVAGQLPLGLSVSDTGRITGYVRPFPDEENPPGYDLNPISVAPFDFISAAISKNYQFTLEVSDGVNTDLRTFTIFVYNRAASTADDSLLTGDNTFVTADVIPDRAPFILNFDPTNIGTIRGDNYFAYRFIGQDFDTSQIEYVISVNEGFGLPPGLELDQYSGWYYGFVPDVGVTETTYSFFIQARQRSIVCTATDTATNRITCDNTARSDVYINAEIEFEGVTFGGLQAGVTYFVKQIISQTEFTVSVVPDGATVNLTTGSGRMLCVTEDLPRSRLYPFSLTVTGDVDREVIWLTPPNLGTVINGDTSLLSVAAVNRGGSQLFYTLRSGGFNELPPGLRLLPSGEIAGRVTFNTFGIDLGATTFDVNQTVTTFDYTFRFTVNAFAEDPKVSLFKLSQVRVINGGTGYSSAPTLTFNTPSGATARQATATAVVVGGSVTRVTVTDSGADYPGPATVTIDGVGTGLQLEVVMQFVSFKRIISTFREFTIRIDREYNRPYQNLYALAMPTESDRELIQSLLANRDIFVPDYVYRPDDPNFGVSTQVRYLHAVGLDPDTLETYVNSLDLNHYHKQLVLGQVNTAQATDSAGNVIYEVVYSRIIDDLVNDQGQSVSKQVNLPYAVPDPADISSLIAQVYPNSLINMRDQVIDSVGQLARTLPLWMTSKQVDGRILGFTPAWVMCYTKPDRARQIAYYLQQEFGARTNLVDFDLDRWIIDGALTKNWDPAQQQWTPTPNLTTFDRVNTTGFRDRGAVTAATTLALTDIDGRNIGEINALGGIDGNTWIQIPGRTPPPGTSVTIDNGSTIIFVKQQDFERYLSTDAAYTTGGTLFDEGEVNGEPGSFDFGDQNNAPDSFDFGTIVPAGTQSACTQTLAATDSILCESTLGMTQDDRVWFTGTVFGDIDDDTSTGLVQLYYIYEVESVTATATNSLTNLITVADTSLLEDGDEIWIEDDGTAIGGIVPTGAGDLPTPYYVIGDPGSTQFQISTVRGGTPLALSTDTGSMTVYLPRFKVATTPDAEAPETLTDSTGSMLVNYGNDRMAIWEIEILAGDVVRLNRSSQTVARDFVETTQGSQFDPGTQLFRPQEAQLGLDVVAWAPLITEVEVVTSETTFDLGSMQFIEPIDIYEPTDAYDKYIVFPKTTILA